MGSRIVNRLLKVYSSLRLNVYLSMIHEMESFNDLQLTFQSDQDQRKDQDPIIYKNRVLAKFLRAFLPTENNPRSRDIVSGVLDLEPALAKEMSQIMERVEVIF